MNENVMRLLREFTPLDYNREDVVAEKEKTGKITLTGIIQRAESLNQNGRVYPRAILEREMRNYQKFIQEKRSLGELDHPDTSIVSLENVSHLMTKIWMEGDVMYGSLDLLDTPKGKIAQSLVESGVTLGISSRGVGSTHKEGDRDIVADDYLIIAWDLVGEPSTSNAFLVREGRQISQKEYSQILSREDRIDRIFNDILTW